MNTEKNNKINKTAIWAITRSGYKLGSKLARTINGSVLLISLNLKNQLLLNLSSFDENIIAFVKLSDKIRQVFHDFTAHIFIFSTGIAVRIIAPVIKSKISDPAVVVLDDNGCHAISLLSGHLGGANKLVEKIAGITGAAPVITTATDVHNKPAIDIIAGEHDLHIVNPGMIKKINMAILYDEIIKIHDPSNILIARIPNSIQEQKNPDIICTDTTMKVPRETLVLNPRSLIVGMGCNRDTTMDEVELFLLSVFRKNRLSLKSIGAFASIDAKKNETGFLELSKKMQVKFLFFDKDRLSLVKNIKNPSKIVEKHMGVKSVCEAAAITAGKNAQLIVQKQIKGNVTMAVARAKPCSI